MEECGICEREGLAIHVIQPPRERDGLLGMRHRGVLIAKQPERVRVPGMREHAEVRAESGALRMLFVVCLESRFEVMSRGLELAKAHQGAAHRVMRFATARWIGHAARERLLR